MRRRSSETRSGIRTRRLWLGLALVWTVAASPALAQQTPRPVRGGTLVMGGPSDLQAMNSLVATETYTSDVIRNLLFLPLVRYSADLQYESALARSWHMLGDTAVLFRLRNDVHWHDGRRTTARDVVFTFERAKDPRTAFPHASDIEHWLSAQQVDSFTVRFRITPHADPLAAWTNLAIMPAHRLERVAPDQMRNGPFNRAPVGNGPFRFVSLRANDRWVFEANTAFAPSLGGRPFIDRIIWRVIPENAAQLTELLTGGIDVMMTPRAEQVKEIGARAGFRAVVKPSRRYNVVIWNSRVPELRDARVRRALLMATNRQQMIDVLRAGFATMGVGPIAPYHWAYNRTLRPVPFDPDGARRLLAAAGYSDRNGDGLLEDAAGEKLEITLKIPANSNVNRDMSEMMRADLARIGVTLRTQPTEFATMIGDISSPERRFDAALLAFETDIRLNLRDAFHSEAMEGPFQSASYRNARVDEILDRTAATVDRAAAARLWSEFQQILLEEQPWGVLYYQPELFLVRERLRGFAPDIRGVFTGVSRWWLAGR